MTNSLVGDVYAKIIEEVVKTSTTDFEESGVSQSILQDLRLEWQDKITQRGIAAMPWDPPKPVQQPQPPPNGLPPSAYSNYDSPHLSSSSGGTRIKTEPGLEGLYSTYPQGDPSQGGLARAQHLVQQQYGHAAGASLSAAQRAGGLALPGQSYQNAKPQGLNMPLQSPPLDQTRFSMQPHPAVQRQQQQLSPQNQPRIKVENEHPSVDQGSVQQQQQAPALPAYSQTDGAAEANLEQWQASYAQRKLLYAKHGPVNDRTIREHVVQMSAELQSGLMVPLDEQPPAVTRKRRIAANNPLVTGAIAQLDGDVSEDEEKPDIKESIRHEDDADAINSDLDDSDEDAKGPMDDEDDEFGDTILCTYDKVQRVKNKWKCTLKDGVMSVNGKEWVFHKGNGEFEW